jgi:hypothetical protein
VDSKHFSVRRHYSQAWSWYHRPKRNSWSTSAFSPSVPMDITDTRLTPAHPWVITVQATFITVSSWAWDLGAAGAIAMAGAGTASSMRAAEATTADLAA